MNAKKIILEIYITYTCRDLNVKNLVYLSSEQALADLAYFIESLIDDNTW